MAASNPKITFSVPYRLFTEGRTFLGENMVSWIWKQIGKDSATIETLEQVPLYKIVLAYQAYKPVDIKFSKVDCQKALKPVFPNGKCLSVDLEYTQHKSKTLLPLIDCRIYFN